MKEKKLVYGVGINDADYRLYKTEIIGYDENGKRILRKVWKCPCYIDWSSMLGRCYSKKSLVHRPTYHDKTVNEEWKTFSNFKAWFDLNYVEGWQLDKDIIIPGNKEYSKEACCYVPVYINSLFGITASDEKKSGLPMGVYEVKGKNGTQPKNKYNPKMRLNGVYKSLGCYSDAFEAHRVWQAGKIEAIKLAQEKYKNEAIFDKRVLDGMTLRIYKIYEDLSNNIITQSL